MKELWAKIREALVSALPITLIVYLIALLPGFSFNREEMIGPGLLMGILVVMAGPAIHVHNAQVEDVTSGYVSKKSMMIGLCATSSN